MRSTPEVCRPSRSHPPPARRAWLALGFAVLVAAALALPPRSGLAAPEVYFSPGGGIRDRLLRQINLTKASIDLAIFDLTSGELAGALMAARARGVAVRIVADARQARGKQSEIPVLLTSGIDVRLASGRGHGIMHHKFAIFDNRVLVTGSYNWTQSAETANHENTLVLDDPALVARYAALFGRLYERAPIAPTHGVRPTRAR